ncbi:uncharacterized protein [Amphiura filiformis]|uniref:uncharacterized protein n=1 Tax=Amphiura filiformis TaxID=82378 RepID=UPI003B2263F9
MIPTISVTEEVVGSAAALHRAVAAGRPRQVRLLIDAGAPVDQPDECGQTALIKAVFVENPRSRLKIMQILLRSGATVSRSDITGRNAFSWACYYGRDKLVDMCIRHRDVDLDLNMSDINGCTPLFHAATSGNAACVKYCLDILCKYALSVDVSNFNGITPLMQALRLGHDVCASILIHQGNASTTVRDSNFLSALDWAERVRGVASDQKSKTIQPAFLPQISQKTNTKPISSKCRAHFIRNRVSSSISDEDSSYDSSSESTWLDMLDFAESNTKTSGVNTARPYSPNIVFGRTPINSPKPGNYPKLGDEADFSDYYSEDCTDSIPEKNPQRLRIQKNSSIPQFHTMLSKQLSATYTVPSPGRRLRSSVVRPDSPEHDDEDCPLECCNASSPSPPSSCRSLPAIRVPEERIRGMVATNRRSHTTESNQGKKRNKGSSMLKKLAKKQLINNLHPQSAVSNQDEESNGFPSLPESGRISLVSSANNARRTKIKDTKEE